ncbi:MAG: sugar phosphate isomerase/epimerase [Pseudomonadota bacterium]|nr:sugar phosphate isomerase/epimerase [Pseudomonadota bacterium]
MHHPRAFGAHTFGLAFDRDAEAALDALLAADFRVLELMATPPHYDPWRPAPGLTRRLGDALRGARARLVALDLASSDVNLAALAPAAVDFAVAAYEALIEQAAEIGAGGVCLHSGRRSALAPWLDARLGAVYRDAFERILRACERAGVMALIENHPAGLLPDAEAIGGFLAGYDAARAGVIYDVANAAAIGEDPAAGLARLAPRLAAIHLSDAPRGAWRHDPIGAGAINFAAALAAAPANAPTLIEIVSPDPFNDLIESRHRLQALAAAG